MAKVNQRSFFVQIKRFAGSLSEFSRDIFNFNRKLVSKLVVYSFLGPTIQASSLGLVLYLTRNLGKNGNHQSISIGPGDGIVINIGLAFALVLFLLSLSIFFLYEAEKMVSSIATHYANKRSAELIMYYPYISHKYDPYYLDDEKRIPQVLVNKVREYSRILTLSSRVILRMPTAVLYTLYGSAFLFYLEPLLTFILIIFLLVLVVPLRRFTRDITRYERLRRSHGVNSRSALRSLIEWSGNIPKVTPYVIKELNDKFNQTAVAESNKAIMMRRISLARSKAIANIALALTIGVSAFYFFVINSPDKTSLITIVAFFIALRLASLGGKQSTGYVAKFARFYNRTHAFLSDRNYADSRKFNKNSELLIRANDIEHSNLVEIPLEYGHPIAVIGKNEICISSLDRLAVFVDKSGFMDRGDIVSGMYLIPDDPYIPSYITWRELLTSKQKINESEFINKAATLCQVLDIKSICHSLDDPISFANGQDALLHRVDLFLLGFYYSSRSILVLPANLCRKLETDFLAIWLDNLKDRYICIYYISDTIQSFECSEKFGVIIGSDRKIIGVASTSYLQNHTEMIRRLVNINDESIKNKYIESNDWLDDEDD